MPSLVESFSHNLMDSLKLWIQLFKKTLLFQQESIIHKMMDLHHSNKTFF